MTTKTRAARVATLLGLCLAYSSANADLACQTRVVFPAGFDKVEGSASTIIPFGLGTAARMQCIYHAEPPGGAAMLTEFAFRADGRKDTEFPSKRFVQLFATIGMSARSFLKASKNYADNRYGESTTVFSGKLELPLQAKQSTTSARPFGLRFKLAKPWLHRGLDHGYLRIEIAIVSQPKGSWDLDSAFVCHAPGKDFGKIGPRCQFSDTSLKGARQPILTNDTAVQIGGYAGFTATNLPDAAPTIFVFGIRDSGPFAGGMLPRAMDDKVFPFPATDCYANTDWLAVRFVASKNGQASARLAIPENDLWRHLRIYCQTLTLDLAANQMGVVWSLGRSVQACGPVRCTRIFTLGSYQSGQGSIQLGSAPVLELTY